MLTWLKRAIASDAFRRRAWLFGIVAVLGYYKLDLTIHMFWTNVDGGYYTDVAAHVRDGHGLVSSCSILYAAYPHFPFPTSVYPLWPLLVGWFAKVFPIFEVGKWLATACYFATLIFGYLWGAALWKKPLLPTLTPGFNAGHVLALMFGLHDFFFQFTSYPYTEGLSFALACAALWRMTRLLPKPTLLGGLEIGVWLGLVILARYQMVLMAMAAFPVFAFAALLSTGPRRQYALMTLAALGGLLIVVGPHYLYVRSFTPNLTPALYVQWQRVRFGEMLSPIPDVLEVKGTSAWILDRLNGLSIAYDRQNKLFGYALRFYTFQYSIVVAAPLVLLRGVQNASLDNLSAAWTWLRRPENLNWVYVVTLALGCFAMIHSMHMHPMLYPEWYFAQRHALVCMFAFFLSLVLLLAQPPGIWQLLGVCILCTSVYIGQDSIRAQVRAAQGNREAAPSPLVQWLNDEAARRGSLVVAIRQPQPFAYLTHNVGYHWYHSHTSYADIRAMVTQLGAAYVIVPSGGFPFQQSPEFARSFHLVESIGGNRIYAPEPSLVRSAEVK